MKATITNAAEITILQPIDNNYKTGGGDISIGACVIIASKGTPFVPQDVYGGTSDLLDKFGMPLHKKAVGMEGLRHVHDASESCSYVKAIRVVNSLTYKFPSLTFMLPSADTTAASDIVQTAAHSLNTTIEVADGAMFTIYPIDGDPSVNRSVEISKVDAENKRFTISIFDKNELGERYKLESHVVSVRTDDVDDMGVNAYIENVFANNSTRFRVDFDEALEWDDAVENGVTVPGVGSALTLLSTPVTVGTESETPAFTFSGGTNGGIPTNMDWMAAIDTFRDERIPCNLLFAAGITEPDLIVALGQVADERHIAFFYDVPPALRCEEAIEWDQDLGLTNRHARAYYSPYSANDPWRGGKCVWGVSGAMAAAKARCNKVVTVGSVPGVHYAPAGEARSYLTRTGIEQLFPGDRINRDKLYDARLNPILPITSGGCGADDDLTHWFKTNYLRFGWINDVLDYIDHRFYEGALQVKFEPDGLTRNGLLNMTKAILDELVTSGALVSPRDPEKDKHPYILTVKQLEIDLWKVTWEVCITGAARRIAGQPMLIK